MRWRDVSDIHNGMKAVVSAKSTPAHPLRGEGPVVGYIECKNPDEFPVLHVGNAVHTFAWYWDVELIQGIAWNDYKGDPANY